MAPGSKAQAAVWTPRTEVDRHASQLVKRVHSLLKDRPDHPLLVLAVNAVRTVATRRGADAPEWGAPPAELPPGLTELLDEEASWLRSASDELIPAYLPALGRAFATSDHSGAREWITSTALNDVIATIVSARPFEQPRRPIRVFDPAIGTGSLMLRVATEFDSTPVVLCGQDINGAMTQVALANAYLSGVEARFEPANALITDAFPQQSFELAVSDPPYGASWSGISQSVADDPRYAGGLPQRSDSSLLFAQILLSKLRPADQGGGRAVMLCAPGPLTDRAGSPIREWLLQNDLVEGIVALPEGLSSRTDIRLFALVLSNLKPPEWKDKVQVVDLRGSYVDAPTDDPERRRLSDQGLSELRRAMGRPMATAVARPVSLHHFELDTVDVLHSGTTRTGSNQAVRIQAQIPRHGSPADWSSERYGVGVMPEVSLRKGESAVKLDVSAIFPDPLDREAPNEIRRLGWPLARLISLTRAFEMIPSAKAADRYGHFVGFPPNPQVLAIPVEPHLDAVVVESIDSLPDSRCLIIDSDRSDQIMLAFIAAWLNSPGGRSARQSALAKAGAARRGLTLSIPILSKAQVAQFLDELIVPVPSLQLQDDIAATTSAIATAARAVSAATRDLWQSPTNLYQLRRRVQVSNEPEDLSEWARRLPYPLAGALWVYETEKHDPLRAEGHLLRFWEATAEFLGAVFLSVLDGDPVLRASEFAALRGALSKAHLSLERATFGTWVAVTQRLASTFRSQLESGAPDSVGKVLQLFADPSAETLAGLLSPEVGRLLSRINSLRNDWHGHAGATTAAQASDHVDALVEHTEELRDLLGTVWEQYRLVRAGRMARRQGRFHVDVELARGPTAPFRRKEIILREPVDEKRLYLTVMNTERALPLNDLVVLRPAPAGAHYTCYFYNRREPSGIRMVSYQYAEESSVIDDVPGVVGLLADFAGESY